MFFFFFVCSSWCEKELTIYAGFLFEIISTSTEKDANVHTCERPNDLNLNFEITLWSCEHRNWKNWLFQYPKQYLRCLQYCLKCWNWYWRVHESMHRYDATSFIYYKPWRVPAASCTPVCNFIDFCTDFFWYSVWAHTQSSGYGFGIRKEKILSVHL